MKDTLAFGLVASIPGLDYAEAGRLYLRIAPSEWRVRHAIGRMLRQVANRVAPLDSYR